VPRRCPNRNVRFRPGEGAFRNLGWVARAIGRVLALLAAAAAAFVLVSCGTSDTEASKVAAALNSGSLSFSQLTGVYDVSCRPAGRRGHLAAFACTWQISGGSSQDGRWTIAHGGLERISQGGDGSTPPSDAAQATAIVNSVVESRGASGTEDCTRDGPFVTIQGHRLSVGDNTFFCLLVGSDGSPLVADGQPVVEKWAWNPDGTVGSETLDTDSTDETAAVAGLTAAAAPSSSGSGNTGTGDTGAGDTGTGNTASGNTGNTGSGNTGSATGGAGANAPTSTATSGVAVASLSVRSAILQAFGSNPYPSGVARLTVYISTIAPSWGVVAITAAPGHLNEVQDDSEIFHEVGGAWAPADPNQENCDGGTRGVPANVNASLCAAATH